MVFPSVSLIRMHLLLFFSPKKDNHVDNIDREKREVPKKSYNHNENWTST